MIRGIYSTSLEAKDFSSNKVFTKKNVSVPQLALQSSEPVMNYSLNNLKANYMPLNDAKTISFCGEEQKRPNLIRRAEQIEVYKKLPDINEIKRKLISTLPDDSSVAINELPKEKRFKGSYYKTLSDDLSILLSTDKDAILTVENGVSPAIFVQNFSDNVVKNKYAKIGFDPYYTDVTYIENPLAFSAHTLAEIKINEAKDADILTSVMKHGGFHIPLKEDEVNHPNTFLSGLSHLDKPDGRQKVVFIKDFDTVISQISNFHNATSMKEFLSLLYPNLSIVGLVNKKALVLPRDGKLITQDEMLDTINVNKHVDEMPKLQLPGLNIRETEDFFKKNPSHVEEALNQYPGAYLKISPKELKELIAKAAAEFDEALPGAALTLLNKVAAAKLNETRSNKKDGLIITTADGKRFFEKHKAVVDISKNPEVKIEAVEKITTQMSDIAGLESAKAKLDDIFEYIQSPDKFLAKGRKVPGGLLFTGPPGTGKTEMARAIAGEVKIRTKKDIPFFYMSGAEFGDKYINSGQEAINKVYDDTREYLRKTGQKVGILFIDEADPIGRKISGSTNSGATEDAKTVNAWKAQMDGFKSKGSDVRILTIAATNHPEVFDDSLLRPSRLRQIEFDIPTTKAVIENLLHIHSKNKPFASETEKKQLLGELAEMVKGLNGDQMTQILDEATRLALKTDKQVITKTEILEGFITTIFGERRATDATPKDRLKSCLHECGHADATVTLKHRELLAITNESRGHALATTFILPSNKGNFNFNDVIKEITLFYGGGEAEKLLNKVHESGVSGDFQGITSYVENAIKKWGLGVYSPQMSFYNKNDEEIVELSKQYSAEMRKDIDLFTEVGQKVMKQITKAHKDFYLGTYLKENEEEILVGKDGKNYLAQDFIDLRQKWLQDTHRVEAEAILEQGSNALIEVASHDKFWTEKAGIANANYILSNGIESIIGLTQEDKWFTNPNKAEAQTHLSKKIGEIVELAQNGSKWLVETGKEHSEKQLVKTIDKIVDAARNGDKKNIIAKILKKAATVVR